MNRLRRPVPAFLIAWTIFVVATAVPTALRGVGGLSGSFGEHRWLTHALLKTLLVLIPWIVFRFALGSTTQWGFARPQRPKWLLVIARGGILGIVTSALIVVTPAKGMTWIFQELGLVGMILWVWLYSSLAEEVFVRGWFQGFVDTGGDARRRIAWSAALFGSLHLSLLWKGADSWTVILIVVSTTILGAFAAMDRERTGSLLPPILTHVAFNAFAPIGGVLGMVIRSMVTGQVRLTP